LQLHLLGILTTSLQRHTLGTFSRFQ